MRSREGGGRAFSISCYRILMRAYTRSFRRAAGDELESVFVDAFRDAKRRGRLFVALLWIRTLLDLLVTAPVERLESFLARWRASSPVRRSSTNPYGGPEKRRKVFKQTQDCGIPLSNGIHAVTQDLRFFLRSMMRRPVFHSVIMLVFALGIGANTIIFGVLDGVVLSPLPCPNPDRLVAPWQTEPALHASSNPTERAFADRHDLSYPIYQDWLELNTVFEAIGVYRPRRLYAMEGDRTRKVHGFVVTHGVLAALGVPPILGRTFGPDDDELDGPRLAVLSHGWWQAGFGSDSSIVDKTVVLNGETFTIVGVMPQGFRFPEACDVWVSVSQPGHSMFSDRDANVLWPVARLRTGITLDRAQREMEVLAERLKELKPIPGKDRGVNVVPLHDDIVGGARAELLFLMGAVGMFLVIACVNIANMLLVRASERRSEMAVRLSLGAGRLRILKQLVTEGLILSTTGGLVGLAAAILLLDPFLSILPPETPRLNEIGVDGRILAVSALLTFLSGIIVAVLPTFDVAGTGLASVLKHAGRTAVSSRSRNRMQTGVLVSQVALAFVFLFAAGLLIRSFERLTTVDRGFEAEAVVVLEVDMNGYRFVENARPQAAYDALVDRLRAIPAVTSVAMAETSPFSWTMTRDLFAESTDGEESTSTHFDRVSASYFETMGIPLLAGRLFAPHESYTSDPIVIINNALAEAFWPNESAVGKRIRDSESPWLTVVGVVGDTRHRLEREPFFTLYYPGPRWYPTLLLKTVIDPTLAMGSIRAAIEGHDAAMTIGSLQELEHTIAATVAGNRVRTVLLSALAALAATLAVVGVFSVLAYAVAQRTREIGIRVALGAGSGQVVGSVMRRSLGYLSAGLAIGAVISLGTFGLLKEFLFETGTFDPTTLFTAALLLSAASLAAAFFPARRAAEVDPIQALSSE